MVAPKNQVSARYPSSVSKPSVTVSDLPDRFGTVREVRVAPKLVTEAVNPWSLDRSNLSILTPSGVFPKVSPLMSTHLPPEKVFHTRSIKRSSRLNRTFEKYKKENT